MNYYQLIKNWHSKASNEDYFSKFVFEYLAFIAFLRKKEFTDAKTDRCALQKLKRSTIKNVYLKIIESNKSLKQSWEKLKNELDEIPLGNVSGSSNVVEEIKWWNCSHSNLQSQTTDEKNRNKGVIHSFKDWNNMVELWSAIRNNLFHGGKNPEERRDKIMVKHGFITIRALMENLLDKKS